MGQGQRPPPCFTQSRQVAVQLDPIVTQIAFGSLPAVGGTSANSLKTMKLTGADERI